MRNILTFCEIISHRQFIRNIITEYVRIQEKNMNMIIAICDDDWSWLTFAEKQLKEYFLKSGDTAEILCFDNGSQLLDYKGSPIDILFMDIEINGVEGSADGIELVRKVNRRWKNCHVIYCTNHLHYAVDVYDTDHTYYIIKSEFEDRIDAVFKRIKRTDKEGKEEVFFHVIGGGMTCFPVKEIRYFERRSRYTLLQTDTGDFHIREKISEISDILPEDLSTRCHSSYLVMMDRISCRTGNAYELKSGENIPISRKFMKATKQDFLNYCEGQMI